jgi:arylsulfatase A-like enzyme
MYEGALRQAAFAWWPGTVPAGRVTDEPWAFWDLMPTFVKLSGATPPMGYETDGLCLVDFLKGGPAPKRDYYYWELHEQRGAARAARWGNWKAVLSRFGKPIEIYDLAQDPGENNDLAAARPELVARAEAIFAEAHRPHPDWPLDHRSEKQVRLSNAASEITSKRRKTGWAPADAKPYTAPAR